MGVRRVLAWTRLAVLFVPLVAVWCLVWLWWDVLSRRGDLTPGGEPLPPLRRRSVNEAPGVALPVGG